MLGLARFFLALAKGALGFVFGKLRSSWPYREGVKLAAKNSDVAAALGGPIEAGWFFSGSLRESGDSGDARLSVPLRGPRAAGLLRLVAVRRRGEWRFRSAEVDVPGDAKPIDLLVDRRARTILFEPFDEPP